MIMRDFGGSGSFFPCMKEPGMGPNPKIPPRIPLHLGSQTCRYCRWPLPRLHGPTPDVFRGVFPLLYPAAGETRVWPACRLGAGSSTHVCSRRGPWEAYKSAPFFFAREFWEILPRTMVSALDDQSVHRFYSLARTPLFLPNCENGGLQRPTWILELRRQGQNRNQAQAVELISQLRPPFEGPYPTHLFKNRPGNLPAPAPKTDNRNG